MGQFASLEDIEQLRFANGTIRLKDFAAVRYVPEDWTDRRRVNGEASLGLSVFKKPEANLVEVARLVEGEIKPGASGERLRRYGVYAHGQRGGCSDHRFV